MSVVLHLSDPHFGTERPGVVTALERLAHALSPTLVVLSGDITQRARRDQFNAAADFMNRLAVPSRLVIAGNHDIPLFDIATRLLCPYSRFRRVFGKDLEPVHDSADLLVIGVCTTRRYRHIEGEVSRRQIERVAQRLRRANPNQLRLVVTHQPVYVTRSSDQEHVLRGAERAIRAWSEAGVDLILGGHIHRPFACALHERKRSLHSPVWAIQAGTAVSARIRHDVGNSVNVIRRSEPGTPRSCDVERWDYDERSQAFTLVERTPIRRA